MRLTGDKRGVPLTAANAEAIAHYEAAIDGYLGFARDTGAHLKQAMAADPDLVMGHCTRGYFFKLFCAPAFEARARQSADAARAAAEAVDASPRERAHVAALTAWCDGDVETAAARWEAILLEHPRDILAHKLAHFVYFYLGDAERMRDSIARTLHAWDERVPGYGYLLGMYGFALEETGDYAAAEDAGRRAVAMNPGDIWAVHAVAHVMEMQGRAREGIDWIVATTPGWQHCNNFAYHVWWHRALFHLELRQYDAVLELYDRHVRADQSDEYLDITNAASLLWRLEDDGVAVGGRWTELAEKAERRKDDHLLAFIDAHFMMAMAATGRDQAARTMLASVPKDVAPAHVHGKVLSEIGVPICAAILAYRQGEYARTVDLLLPVRYAVRRIGGSHAQRDVFARLLIEAALRAGRFGLARALLSERAARRPNSPWTWTAYARALDGLGDTSGADAMRSKAQQYLEAAT